MSFILTNYLEIRDKQIKGKIMTERESLFKQYRTLVQYKKKTDKQLYALVDKKLAEEPLGDEVVLDLKDMFTDKKDLKKGKELAKQYLEQKEFDTIAELQNLKNIIWLEVEIAKIQDLVQKKREMSENYLPEDEVKSLLSMMKQVSDLKKELGFYTKEKEESDGYKIVTRMMDRAKVWREKNQGTRSLICPHCQKMVLLKIRTDKYDAQSHPFFEDRVLSNPHLIKMYAEGKISVEDVAKVLEVSVDYVNPWLINKWKSHPKYEKMIQKIKVREEEE